ncbi:hypothetical protein GCK72_017778 [Caenorhabditis remanei]|uniref:Uncharacterized protein n=1 Tax=Caenorhabditis remanei TaxID=31234 RepID=A0A6A5G9E3_CAERE|nr:hypothetical protein GCK72_017778 [Caenorhabditis remanei]KAF1751224.1 hypothetical protein GCK72_017778 [Caenorhabditis remanei]
MLPSRVESDDGYVPAGLLNCPDNTLESSTIKGNEIHEFYNLNKTDSPVIEKSPREPGIFVDLSAKNKKEATSRAVSTSTPSSAPKRPARSVPRVLTIQPGSHLPLLPSDNQRPLLPPRSFHPRGVLPPPLRQTMYRPIAFPPMYQYGGRQMIPSQRPMPFHPPGRIPMKPQPVTIAQQQAMMNPNMYGQPYNTPIPQMRYPSMVVVQQPGPYYPPVQALARPLPQTPVEPIMPPPELKPKVTPETRKKLREEATAKLKAERDARRALARAKKLADKARTMAVKKKKESAVEEGN